MNTIAHTLKYLTDSFFCVYHCRLESSRSCYNLHKCYWIVLWLTYLIYKIVVYNCIWIIILHQDVFTMCACGRHRIMKQFDFSLIFNLFCGYGYFNPEHNVELRCFLREELEYVVLLWMICRCHTSVWVLGSIPHGLNLCKGNYRWIKHIS